MINIFNYVTPTPALSIFLSSCDFLKKAWIIYSLHLKQMSFYDLKLISLFVAVVFIAEIFASLTAFKLILLPEFALAITLVYLLAVLAIKLGEGYNKKVLAVETLDALCVGIGYTLILYFYNFLNYEEPDIIFNGYLHSNMYVIMLKIVLTSVG